MKEENNKMNISRRGFLKTAALAGAALRRSSVVCRQSCHAD